MIKNLGENARKRQSGVRKMPWNKAGLLVPLIGARRSGLVSPVAYESSDLGAASMAPSLVFFGSHLLTFKDKKSSGDACSDSETEQRRTATSAPREILVKG
jgi:hypothetical protein